MKFLTETRLVEITMDYWDGNNYNKTELDEMDESLAACKTAEYNGETCHTITDAALGEYINWWTSACTEANKGYDHDIYEDDDDYINSDEHSSGKLMLTDWERDRDCSWDITVNEQELEPEETVQTGLYSQVKQLSKIGRCSDTFAANYKWVPEAIKDKLTAAELATLVDTFYDCYRAGQANPEQE